MTELEKYKLKEKIIIYRKLRFRGFYNFVIDFFKNEIEKNIFGFANLPKLISEKKTEDADVLIEDAWEKIKIIDYKEINHKGKIIFKKLNNAYCTNCNQIIYITSDFLEAKKRIELNQPIIINDDILKKDLIENLVENNHNCLIFYSDLFEKKEIGDFEDLFKMKTSEIYKLKLLRDLIICESKYSNHILNELKKENHNNISFYNLLGIELKCKNYYNSIELIDEFLYNNFNFQNGQSLFSERVKAIYSINIDILKLLLNVSENNLKFYRCKIKEDFLIHFSDDKKYSILIPKKLTEMIKNNRNYKIDIFIDVSNKFNTNYIINVFQNVENESHYNYLLENEKKIENSDFGPQSYGYSSWDDFAFNTAFEGDIDAWNEYNQ